MPPAHRILDANANRAREAMRVMEEAARFSLDDAKLTRDLKKLRHDFAAALRKLPSITSDRDTPGDVGTALSTKSEATRTSVHDVAAAAGKRLGEALRCCEEYGKLVDPAFALAVEKLRYRGYDLEQRLLEALAPPAVRQWRVCVIVTESLCTHHDWPDVAKAALDGGADCLQLREKTLTDAELLDRAAYLVDLAGRARREVDVIINDRPDIADLAGATGMHLGTGDLPVDAVRDMVGRSLVIGASTHTLAEAKSAIASGVDYCGVGAIYETETKRRKPSGLAYLKKFLAKHPAVPHLAIGGINPANIAPVAAVGARGVAVSSVVCGASKPDRTVRELLRGLR